MKRDCSTVGNSWFVSDGSRCTFIQPPSDAAGTADT
jgi:hypothetical protein